MRSKSIPGDGRPWRMRALLMLLAFHFPVLTASASDGIDDYLQYTPYASLLLLKTCGVPSRDEWPQLLTATAASWVVAAGAAYTLKHTVREWRPDHTDRRSFPSGHAGFAFAGATMLHKEFGRVSPWISVAGYGVAAYTAIDRVLNDRHHWYDVAAGAGIGILSAELTCCLTSHILKKQKVSLGLTGSQLDVAIQW